MCNCIKMNWPLPLASGPLCDGFVSLLTIGRDLVVSSLLYLTVIKAAVLLETLKTCEM